MNKEWSNLNATLQVQLRKEATFQDGKTTLNALRRQLMDVIISFEKEVSRADFNAVPYVNAHGYHSKSIAYSLWHIFRIEDIVAHTLIADSQQIFFAKNYQARIGSSIITTGNEISNEQLSDFSKTLNLQELYLYIDEVYKSTEEILKALRFSDIKNNISADKKEHLQALDVVSLDENAHWLIDYWCGKQIVGLIQMPLSRHWIMHIEACLRIRDKLNKKNLKLI